LTREKEARRGRMGERRRRTDDDEIYDRMRGEKEGKRRIVGREWRE
jgi:hypothetical protein